MLVRKTGNQQRELARLLQYAATMGGIDYTALDKAESDELADLAESAAKQLLTKAETVRLTELVQKCVRLPGYSTAQAAAWLGLSVRGIFHAMHDKRIEALKPGHDLVIPHDQLERYHRERPYSLA